jgi:L-cystine transport system substrate-binding protein
MILKTEVFQMKKFTVVAVLMSIILVVSGCGTKSSTKDASGSTSPAASQIPAATQAPAASAAPAPKAVKKIIVGTSGTFPQVTFTDTNNKLTGYDVELLREIDKRLPDYEFVFQTAEFKSLLLNLETKKIDLVANEMEKNPERAQKYLFNKESYAYWKTKVVVAKDNNTIKSIDDLKGKKVLTSATSAEATILENYNKSHDNAIKIVYTSGAANDTTTQISSGRVDATIGADFILPITDPEGKLKTVGPILTESNILFVFRKDDPDEQALADKIDQAIKDLKADGTLVKLSQQWLKTDVTKLND